MHHTIYGIFIRIQLGIQDYSWHCNLPSARITAQAIKPQPQQPTVAMTLAQVPRAHQVIPGANVSIVLKADQRTGRQVRGTVQHVLTRGDHHRGIKVRLTDGRVGRGKESSELSSF